jgi:hypothetical protein
MLHPQQPCCTHSTQGCHAAPTAPRAAIEHPEQPCCTQGCYRAPRAAMLHPGLPCCTQGCHAAPRAAMLHPGLPCCTHSSQGCHAAPRAAIAQPWFCTHMTSVSSPPLAPPTAGSSWVKVISWSARWITAVLEDPAMRSRCCGRTT